MMLKWINSLKVAFNCIAETHIKAYPILLEIEPTNHCNVKCIACPNNELKRPKGYMDISLFKKIVDETIPYAWEYAFDMLGEPTLHKDIIEMITYVKQQGGNVALFTNLNYINPELSEAIVKSPVDRLIINISESDKFDYEKTIKNGNFDTVFKNLQAIKHLKIEYNSLRPKLIASYLQMTSNEGRQEKNIQELKKHFDYCLIKHAHDWLGHPKVKPLRLASHTKSKRKCSNLWSTATILWDGRVAVCSHDAEGKRILGDATKSSLFNIWNSEKNIAFRKSFRNNPFCQKCDNEMSLQFSLKNLSDYFQSVKPK